MTPNDIIARGERASRLIENEDFKDLIAAINDDIFEQFRRTRIDQKDEREQIHQVSYAVDLLIKKLNKYKSDAKLEIDKLSRV